MLSAIFGSEARARLLNILLLDPEKKYDLKTLSKEAGVPLPSARKELKSLAEFGLVRETDDNWHADKNFVIFPELRALVVKAQILSSQKFLEGLKKISQLKLLVLTGLFTGDQEAKTDILMVGSLKRPAFLKLVAELEADLGREINYTILTEAEYRYRQEVMDIFVFNILAGKIIILIDEISDQARAI